MARRRSRSEFDEFFEDLSTTLMQLPAWAGPALAFGAYVVLAGIFPSILASTGSPMLTAAAGICAAFAPFGAFFVLLAWAFAMFGRSRRRKLFDTRSDAKSLRTMSWQDFELLVGEAYRRQGYVIEERGGGGADGGVDLILRREGEMTLVQCKQWKSWKVGVNIVRELYGVMAANQPAKGIVVTCGRFTRDAREFAKGKPLELVDGPALWELVKAVKTGATQTRELSAQPSEPSVSSSADRTQTDPAIGPMECPKCGSAMVLRTARKGQHAGSQFYGCSHYPRCHGIRKIEVAPN